MTTPPTRTNAPPPDDGRDDAMPPPRDELDALLREWHTVHADRARAGRDRLLAALARENNPAPTAGAGQSPIIRIIRSTIVNRYSPLAAAALVAVALAISFLIPGGTPSTLAQERSNIVMAPEGGRLDAFTPDGEPLGPCELARTDVSAEIAGFLTRVTLRQTYRNPHDEKIEAVYTFPLSHRAAVDRMRMIIGDRVVVGEVRERNLARQMYESARDQGRIASLLEQERPNIFTQSVANIEPGAQIDIEISYVELIEPSDGTYTFTFPTVVGPRYIPGSPSLAEKARAPLPDWLTPRRGIVLLAPGVVTITRTGDENNPPPPALTPARLGQLLAAAIPCYGKGQGGKAQPPHPPRVWHEFTVTYPDGSSEHGMLDADGSGHISGRGFWIDPEAARAADASTGQGFAPDTDQVPDASRITPMPVRPEVRAGHTIGISVTIDGGGAPVEDLVVPLHAVNTTRLADAKIRVNLKNQEEIPNRDFVLSWRLAGDEVRESVFTHTGPHGNFFTMILQPPARVEPEQAVPRELVFVLDTSGSMSGFPIEKAKEVMSRAIDAMRERDTFNIITFSGDTRILWDRPRPNTPENRAEAQRFLAARAGGGGTEMMKAIEAALAVNPAPEPAPDTITLQQLTNLPADGREVTVELPWDLQIGDDGRAEARPGVGIRIGDLPASENFIDCPVGEPRLARGVWETVAGERRFRPVSVRWKHGSPHGHNAVRIVTFMTDGYVGNDMAIIDAIRRHRGTTRVFSFGIGNSVNRYLLDNMARAGGGEAEYVLLESDADEAVERFTRRISTPVLANIGLRFSDNLQVVDVLPSPDEGIPDLFDQRPLVIHGRYTAPGSGTLTITGLTGRGPYERTITLDLPAHQPKHSVIATLWARKKIESLMNRDLAAAQTGQFPDDLRRQIVTLGETFGIMSRFTSFIAIDKLRVTIDGQPRLITIPIEMPDRVSYEGVFGDSGAPFDETRLGAPLVGLYGLQLRVPASARPPATAGERAGHVDADGDGMMDTRWFEAPAAAPAQEKAGREVEQARRTRRSAPSTSTAAPKPAAAIEAAPTATEALAAPMEPILTRLDPALLPLITPPANAAHGYRDADQMETARAPMAKAGQPAGAASLIRPDGTLLLTILVAAADEPTLTAIKALGATVVHHSPTMNVIIVTLAPKRLADLAAVPGVRRIEPTRDEPAQSGAANL